MQIKTILPWDKTHLTHSNKGVKFLEVEIGNRYTRIQKSKLKGLKERVKELTKRNGGLPLSEVIARLNPLLRVFGQYFRIANCTRDLKGVASWVRRRLRSIQLRLWKKPSRLHRRLRQPGYTGKFKCIRMACWVSSLSPLAHYAMPNEWFKETGLFDLESIITGNSAPSKGI